MKKFGYLWIAVKNGEHCFMEKARLQIQYDQVGEVPVAFYQPVNKGHRPTLTLWIPYLGGNKDTGKKELELLASAGFLAVSFDPFQHGGRSFVKKPGLRSWVFEDFSATMWNIIGITTLDAFRITDWFFKKHELNEHIVAGGLSMGGDIAISLAGIDRRIRKIATVASSPDWMRPGMTDVMDSAKIIKQGDPTPLGEWLYSRLNPLTNLNSYINTPEMLFELDELDTHISSSYAVNFKNELSRINKKASERIIININEGAWHISMLQKKSVIIRAINYLIE